ncbi:MAG: tRNA (pseudouridine(54)-N(1))-methyltransferase TrmY [bacterium]|nr:tRNA (pseudouridine(54)-N(1))-methyltransferase TrmY [bacterium]
MREFILRARKGPTTPNFSLSDLSRAGRMEIVAHCMANALFYSNHLRQNIRIHIVLDGPDDPPKTIRFESDTLASLDGFDEQALARAIQTALQAGRTLETNEEIQVDGGIFIAKRGLERLVQEKAAESPLYCLDRKGADIRTLSFPSNATFVFTDHLSMPKKTDRYLHRLGATPISVGPKVLFASQCIVLVHNELDRQNLP